MDELTKRLVERALDGEMTDHLGYEPHSPTGKNTRNSRNGKTHKTVQGKHDEMDISVPICQRDDHPGDPIQSEIRLVIYATTAVESIQTSPRKVTKNCGAFPNPDSVQKILYLAIERLSKKRKRPIRDWVSALNHFTIVFEERVPI